MAMAWWPSPDGKDSGAASPESRARARLAECRDRRQTVMALAERPHQTCPAQARDLQLLALPYYDHPDYQPTWLPPSTVPDP